MQETVLRAVFAGNYDASLWILWGKASKGRGASVRVSNRAEPCRSQGFKAKFILGLRRVYRLNFVTLSHLDCHLDSVKGSVT